MKSLTYTLHWVHCFGRPGQHVIWTWIWRLWRKQRSWRWTALPFLPLQGYTWWWRHRGYKTGKGRSHLWSHIEGKRVSPLKGLYLPASHYTTPRALTGMSLGLSCAGNSNAVKSQLKPTHKSHLMLPWWVESNMPDLLIICQTLGSQPPSSKI